jgi:hypothetical protein
MDGIIWLFLALLGTFMAVGVVAAGRQGSSGVNTIPRHCASCQTPMSLRRVPILRWQRLLGAWECPHCGARTGAGIPMSRSGPL